MDAYIHMHLHFTVYFMTLQLVCTVGISVLTFQPRIWNLIIAHMSFRAVNFSGLIYIAGGRNGGKKYIRSNVMIMQQNYKTLCWSSVKDARMKKKNHKSACY